jgi:hypothetical protein
MLAGPNRWQRVEHRLNRFRPATVQRNNPRAARGQTLGRCLSDRALATCDYDDPSVKPIERFKSHECLPEI